MVVDVLVAAVVVAFSVAGAVVVESLLFRRERRRWRRESEEFWRTIERLEPGIRERLRARRRGKE